MWAKLISMDYTRDAFGLVLLEWQATVLNVKVMSDNTILSRKQPVCASMY